MAVVAVGACVLRNAVQAAYIRDGGDVVPVHVGLRDVVPVRVALRDVAGVAAAVGVLGLRDGHNVFPFLRASTLYQHVQVLFPLLLPELLRLRFLLLSL